MMGNNTVIPYILVIACVGVLLFPSYYSTDFDVHRNWLSITRHLPLAEWYFDNQDGQTVHTLDYPPMFAYFEAFLSNNYITRRILEDKLTLVDSRCFQMLPDSDNRVPDNCVAFHRSTVIVSYTVYVLGAVYVARVLSCLWNEKHKDLSSSNVAYTIMIALLTLNPGLIFLDFVHFQYNGLLLGILLLSVSFITQASMNPYRYIHHDIVGGILFAFLLGMKHLYLSLGPLYFTYLLRHYCFFLSKADNNKNNEREPKNHKISSSDRGNSVIQFSLLRFFQLSLVTLVMLFLPYLPIILYTSSPMEQMKQIFSRLFPFGRGLVHEYWAGNIWAIYLFFSKCFRYLAHRGFRLFPFCNILDDGFPDVTPAVSAVLSLIALAPALFCAYKVAAASLQKPLQTPLFFLHATAYCSLSAFMLGFHVHEKAIMSTIIPLTLLSLESADHARLYIRVCAFGHLGLFPLLFRPVEGLFKISAYVVHLSLSVLLLEIFHSENANIFEKPMGGVPREQPCLLTYFDKFYLFLIICLIIYMEILHNMPINPLHHLEFLPLMANSVFCAVGLFFCWISLTKTMWKYSFHR